MSCSTSTVPSRSASLRQAATVVGARKAYGQGETQVVALDDVSVDFHRGRFTAVMGPSGSGKSTLLHCVAGLDRLDAGHVCIGDTDLASLDERALTTLRRDRIGFVFQAYNLVPTLTARENILLPASLAGRRLDDTWLELVVDTLGIGARLDHRPSELSGGQQQRVAIARAIAGRPDIVFADEPTGNLDSKASADILAFLRYAVDELAQTVVMVTHDPVAAAQADRAVFLADGRVVDDLDGPTPDAVLGRITRLGG